MYICMYLLIAAIFVYFLVKIPKVVPIMFNLPFTQNALANAKALLCAFYYFSYTFNKKVKFPRTTEIRVHNNNNKKRSKAP